MSTRVVAAVTVLVHLIASVAQDRRLVNYLLGYVLHCLHELLLMVLLRGVIVHPAAIHTSRSLVVLVIVRGGQAHRLTHSLEILAVTIHATCCSTIVVESLGPSLCHRCSLILELQGSFARKTNFMLLLHLIDL